MDSIDVLPKVKLMEKGSVSARLLGLGCKIFLDAAKFIKEQSYGYNDSEDNPLTLLDEGKGTCTTKHGLLALGKAEPQQF